MKASYFEDLLMAYAMENWQEHDGQGLFCAPMSVESFERSLTGWEVVYWYVDDLGNARESDEVDVTFEMLLLFMFNEGDTTI